MSSLRPGAASAVVILGVLASARATAQAPAPNRGCATPNRPCSDARRARTVQAVRTPHPPTIDGRLTDDAWMLAPPATEFTQRDPLEGTAPSQKTEIRFLYDDQALYIAARMFDTDPMRIGRRMSARDDSSDVDSICFYLDPLHDRRTGAIFRVTAANVQEDSVLFNDSWTDGSWDAVWQSAVSVDDQGWAAELRIPLSQLRFIAGDRQVWGLNVERQIQRNNESIWLEMVPKSQSGIASRMIDLTGLDGLKPARRFEWLPYAAARAEYIAPDQSNDPFNDGSRAFAAAGLDLKWGLTSNLTINGTVNPDFGQVEVDPAVVNLTAFETFFDEKRPFFLEGSQIFTNYGHLGANDFWGFNNSEPQIFYSRRIGRAPQMNAVGDYTDAPDATTIIGAAKLTGKTTGGWSLGFLEALTGEETARTQTNFTRGSVTVEPLTNYSVIRVQRDLGARAGMGFLTTTVHRRLTDERLHDGLPDRAYVYGADGYWFVDRKKVWAITANAAASTVLGTPDAISRLQLAPQRYFQRPDTTHVHFDPTRTALSGFTGRLSLNRNQGRYWRFNSALWAASPGFESNDLGFHSTGDRAGSHAVVLFRNVEPTRWSRQWSVWAATWWTWNYGRDLQGNGINSQAYWQFLNYWHINANVGWARRVVDDRLTRGGPSATLPAGGFWNVNVNSDSRRTVAFNWNANASRSEAGDYSRNSSIGLTLKPLSRVLLNVNPSWNRRHALAQYVRTVVDPSADATFGSRYVFGAPDQRQLSIPTRVSLILTPRVSFRLYMQPLLATGKYGDFKELARPRTFDFLHYGQGSSTLDYNPESRLYTADPDGSGDSSSFDFVNPDFNLKSLRVNTVFRWEMKPGSAFYAVWTRQQQDLSDPGHFVPGHDLRLVFGAPGDDVVLFKFTYWLGR